MISTEQIFKYQDINVKYKFKPQSTDSNHLFVVFSGFGSNSESIYDFIGESALSVKGNILYIKDEFFGGATYYLCHNNDFTIEKSIIALINNFLTNLSLDKTNCSLVGFSKGGSAALYYGLKYNFKNIISTVPQILLGTYVDRQWNKVANRMLGENYSKEDVEVLDSLIPNLLKNDLELNKNIYLFTSTKDIQYIEQIEPFKEYFDKYENFNYLNTESRFVDRHNVVTSYNLPILLSIKYALSDNIPIRFGKIKNGGDISDKNYYIEQIKTKKEFVARLDIFDYKDGLFFPEGICFLKGYPYTGYGLISYDLVFESENILSKFKIGTAKKDVSKEYFDKYNVPYIFVGFASLGFKGINLNNLPDGKYELYINAKTYGFENKIKPSISNLKLNKFDLPNFQINIYEENSNIIVEKKHKLENVIKQHNNIEKKIFFPVKSIGENRGGLTLSIYKKASILSEKFDVTILVLDFQLNFELVLENLYKNNTIDRRVKVVNFHHQFNNINSSSILNIFNQLTCGKNFYKIQEGKGFTRIFLEDGTYYAYIKYLNNENKDIYFIDIMCENDPNNLKKRYFYFRNKCYAIAKFKNKQMVQTVIYENNQPFLSIWQDDKLNKRVFKFDNDDVIETNYINEYKFWFQKLIEKDDIVMLDAFYSEMDNLLADINCKKIGFFHSNQKYCKDTLYLTNNQSYDKFIFLTEKQKQDVSDLNGYIKNKSLLLPHSYNYTKNLNHRENKFVTISRLNSNQKCILDGIYAFDKIKNIYPDLIYEIYGIGPDELKIKETISNLGLVDRIFLKGYTNDSLLIFSNSIFSLNLSKFEGFGLSILESLSMSCPTIVYAVDYGPEDIVIDNINGKIISFGDIDSLADAILKIMKNANYFQNNCIKNINKFEPEKWKEKLFKLIEDL